jgi:hypothetical protein
MPDKRFLLRVDRLEPFKKWLEARGIPHRLGKGDYQVLQVLVGTKNNEEDWGVVFSRKDMTEYFSLNEKLIPIVQRFIASSGSREDKLTAAVRAATKLRKSFVDLGSMHKMLDVPREEVEAYDKLIEELRST